VVFVHVVSLLSRSSSSSKFKFLFNLVVTLSLNIYVVSCYLGLGVNALLNYHYVITLIAIILNLSIVITYVTVQSLVALNIYWIVTTTILVLNVTFLICMAGIMVSIYDFIYNEFLTLVNYNYSKYYNLTSVKDTILYNFTCIYDMCMKLVYRLYDHNTIFNSNQTLTLCGKNTYQLNYKLQNYPNTLDRVNEISNIVSPYLYEFIKAVCSIID